MLCNRNRTRTRLHFTARLPNPRLRSVEVERRLRKRGGVATGDGERSKNRGRLRGQASEARAGCEDPRAHPRYVQRRLRQPGRGGEGGWRTLAEPGAYPRPGDATFAAPEPANHGSRRHSNASETKIPAWHGATRGSRELNLTQAAQLSEAVVSAEAVRAAGSSVRSTRSPEARSITFDTVRSCPSTTVATRTS